MTAPDAVEARGSQLSPGNIRRYLVNNFSTLWAVSALLVALCLYFGFASPHRAFFQYGNIVDMANAGSELLLLAAGMTFVLSAGALDLSIGANVIVSSVLGAKTITALAGTHEQIVAAEYPHLTLAIIAGFCVCVFSAATYGAINGLIVTKLRINSFIATLATTGIGIGVALILAGGVDVPYLPPSLQTQIAARTILKIPVPVFVTLVICVFLMFTMNRSRFGTWTQAIGSSRVAAQRAGIKVDAHMLRIFILMGALAGVAACIDIARFASTNITGHQSDALAAIAAVVIGGTSLFGGRGGVGGSMVGGLLPVILATGLVMVGLSPDYQLVAVGGVLLVAVFIDQRRPGKEMR